MIRQGCKHLEGPLHDCDHVEERKAIAEHASRVADAKAGPIPPSALKRPEWAEAWDQAYHEEIRFQDGLARRLNEVN